MKRHLFPAETELPDNEMMIPSFRSKIKKEKVNKNVRK
jgi:hypothetical protein